jgi:hypothetical protein
MKGRVLAAGWPFAGLLALDAGRAEVCPANPVSGRIAASDERTGALILESGEVISPFAALHATRFYGVDGYPISREDIRIGDEVEIVQDRVGGEWLTTRVRVLRHAPRAGPGEDSRGVDRQRG